MKIEIEIPKFVVARLKDCNYTDKQIQNFFREFVAGWLDNGYTQTENDFDIWIEEMEDEEVERILNK